MFLLRVPPRKVTKIVEPQCDAYTEYTVMSHPAATQLSPVRILRCVFDASYHILPCSI